MALARIYYVSDDAYKKELTSFFYERLYLGTKFEFLNLNSYKSLLIGEYAITCRATASGVKTFNNVCLHRNNLIDPLGTGSREFQCGYHGWRYDSEGTLALAPLCDMVTIQNKQLDVFPVAESGGMLFAGLNSKSPQVSEVGQLLETLDISFEEPAFAEGELLHQCNWKLLVENVLEGYHVNFVHKDSFVPAGGSSTLTGDTGSASYTSWAKFYPDTPQISHSLKYFPGAKHLYHHGFVFPNLFVANTNNLIGYAAYLLPISKHETLLKWQLFELPVLLSLPSSVRQKIREDAVNIVKKTLVEDKDVVESCQLGLQAKGPEAQLQPQELRIEHFHSLYRSFSAE